MSVQGPVKVGRRGSFGASIVRISAFVDAWEPSNPSDLMMEIPDTPASEGRAGHWHTSWFRRHPAHTGFASLHFFLRLRHVRQPVFSLLKRCEAGRDRDSWLCRGVALVWLDGTSPNSASQLSSTRKTSPIAAIAVESPDRLQAANIGLDKKACGVGVGDGSSWQMTDGMHGAR